MPFFISLIIALAAVALATAQEQIAGRYWNVPKVIYAGGATLLVLSAVRFILSGS